MEQTLYVASSPRGASAAAAHANQVSQLATFMRRNAELTAEAADVAGMTHIGRMSEDDAISFKATTGLPWKAMRTIASFLRTHHSAVFPPEYRIRQRIAERHLNIPMVADILDGTPVIHAADISAAIRDATLARWKSGALVWWPSQAEGTLDLTVGIDRGSQSTKLQILWANSLQPQSSLSALVIGLYEGPDDYEHLAAAFRAPLAELAHLRSLPWTGPPITEAARRDFGSFRFENDCKDCDHPITPTRPSALRIERVNIFYDGDTIVLNELLGLSGHSSCHPCPVCKVHKDDLRYDARRVHSLGRLGAAAPPWRSEEELEGHHDDFVHVSQGVLRHARKHQNAVRPSLLATSISGRIVPPCLHIVTGVSQMLLDHLEEVCAAFDKASASPGEPFMTAVRAACHCHSVYRQPPYMSLTGDGARRFLANAGSFADAMLPRTFGDRSIGASPEQRAGLVAIMAELNSIASMILRAAPLCDHTCDRLQRSTDHLAELWHDYFPGRDLTPKLHMLFVDVPRFARQHRMVRCRSAAFPDCRLPYSYAL